MMEDFDPLRSILNRKPHEVELLSAITNSTGEIDGEGDQVVPGVFLWARYGHLAGI